MKAILIDPSNQSITEVRVKNDADYHDTARLIGAASGLIAPVETPAGDIIYVDDEGLLTNPNPHGYFRLSWYPGQVFAGKGLLLGTGDEGEDVDAEMPLDELRRHVTFEPAPSCIELEPRIEFYSF